eukprot:TRINITY_DN2157_c0_g1_i18.p1 TRINITY_DN2157_c0_g1~~TRINITY_DN2157_c0_g1_i18.p1  ORF type:complete len:533 (-),score=59.66 TRINITY_DN2157_c0_g1_i18:164-1762(-)
MLNRTSRSPMGRSGAETKLLLKNFDDDDSDDERASYEEAVEKTGYRKFHYLLLLVCGWANASDAIEIICISFLLPSAECDLNMDSVKKGWVTSSTFIGMMIGGYVWGALGDSLGRRLCLIYAMVVNALAGGGSSLAQDYWVFVLMRFLSGVGVGGSIPVVWTYFAEFQPAKYRGGALSFLASFWMVGNVTVAGLAWLIIPHHLGVEEGGFKFNSWRIFVVLSAVPSLLVAFSLTFLPESPKFLLTKGRHDEALQVLRRMYSMNTGREQSSYPIHQLEIEELSPTKVKDEKVSTLQLVKEAGKNTARLFHKKHFRVTVIMIVINFAIQFGYYGLWLWFPQLFSKLKEYEDQHPGSDMNVCTVISQGTNSTSSGSDLDCANHEPPASEVFLDSFIISCAAGPSNLWTILCMDKLGRRFFLSFSMVLSGACAFFIYLVKNSLSNLILSCVFGAVSTMGFNSLDCLSIELFPTSVRGTAMAITLVSARIGAILGGLVFGYLVDVNCAIPIVSVAVLLTVGGLMGFLLPNTTKKPLL